MSPTWTLSPSMLVPDSSWTSFTGMLVVTRLVVEVFSPIWTVASFLIFSPLASSATVTLKVTVPDAPGATSSMVQVSVLPSKSAAGLASLLYSVKSGISSVMVTTPVSLVLLFQAIV